MSIFISIKNRSCS